MFTKGDIGSTGEEGERHQSEEVFEGAQSPFQRHPLRWATKVNDNQKSSYQSINQDFGSDSARCFILVLQNPDYN